MYLSINNTPYPCTDRRLINGSVYYYGVTGLTLPISGTIQLCRDDGFLLAEDDTTTFSRHVLSGTKLTLTNEPEPEPIVPGPTLDQRVASLENQVGEMATALTEGVNSING